MTSETSSVETEQWILHAMTDTLGNLQLAVTDTLSIGRGQDNDLVLGSKKVSRHHASFDLLNGKLLLKDLGSSNGTQVNNEAIEANKSRVIHDKDVVNIAGFEFKLTLGDLQNLESEKIESEGVKDIVETPEDSYSDAESNENKDVNEFEELNENLEVDIESEQSKESILNENDESSEEGSLQETANTLDVLQQESINDVKETLNKNKDQYQDDNQDIQESVIQQESAAVEEVKPKHVTAPEPLTNPQSSKMSMWILCLFIIMVLVFVGLMVL